MNTNRMMSTSNGSHQKNMKAIPNPEMLSRQIESLRVVVRRMKAYESSTLNSLITQKLKELK